MSEMEKLPNLGKVNAEKLHEVGIDTPEQLRALGAKETFLRLHRIDPGACLHLLNALEGVRKTELSPEVKQSLKEFHQSVQKETDS